MTTDASPRPLPHWTLALAGTALAYALVGWASLWLAVAPSIATPLYPPAGIALACVLTYGVRVLPGVGLGCIAVNVWLAIERGTPNLESSLLLPVVIACGAMLQAWAGAVLVNRYSRHHPITLSEPRDIAVFFWVGAVATCFISSGVATAALYLLANQPASMLAFNWFVWASGDAVGVLVAAPLTLTLIGRPRAEWASRRLTVGLSLAVATAFMALGIKQVSLWSEDRVAAGFERDAVNASTSLAAQLDYPLHALEAMRGVWLASEDITRSEMQRATAAWLNSTSQLQAIGWNEFVPRERSAAFQAEVRATDFPDYRVFDRTDSDVSPQPKDRMAVMRYVEPLQGNEAALGVNARSIVEARLAIDAAVRTDQPTATAGFRATQDQSGDATAVVIYQAVYSGTPTTEEERVAAARGVLFVTLRMERVLDAFQHQLPPYLKLCVVDTDPGTPRRRLAGDIGCEARTAEEQHAQLHVRPVTFAGRQWDLRVSALRDDLPGAHEPDNLLFSLMGLVAAGMLGALLLTVTGRAHRIEAAVHDRTAALQHEIGERERTEASLRESEQRFRNILNTVPIGVVYTDLDGNVKQVNPRFCELTSYRADELMGMNVATLTHPDDRVQDLALIGQLVRGEIPSYRRQGRYLTRHNRMVWVQSIVTMLRDVHGAPHRIVGVVEDITEHLRLAEAERAREIAEAANMAKSEFLSRMSHELRTPLNAMLGFAQLLELDQVHPLPTSQRPWVMQIQAAGWHLLDMINDVLDLSRIESGTLNLQPDKLDLRQVIATALPLVQQDAQRRNITVTQDVAADRCKVSGDSTRVKQILINLLSNAVKYNSDGGRIHISTRAGQRDSIDLIVTDTGLGMTPQQLAQLFQPFNRLGRERSSLEGTGIGLVISQRLAELMGGALRARSTAGEGSSFILSLPHAGLQDTAAGLLDEESATPSDYHQRTVHYVEDNETNVEVMRGILSRRPQVKLEVSITGLDGLSAIRSHRPDLVLLDMHLPDIDGLELLRHLKADPATADIPVVVVSADALSAQIDVALQAGALQYLTKPVSVSELLSVVDTLLDEVETKFG